MTVEGLRSFLDSIAFEPDFRILFKRLSANDTQATGGHQAGPYLPRDTMLLTLPELNKPESENPRIDTQAVVESHGLTASAKVIWYNNKLRSGSRNEIHFTGWGGRNSPLLDPDLTGAATMFVFGGVEGERTCRIWICSTEDEADLIAERYGPVEPGRWEVFPPHSRAYPRGDCSLSPAEIPPQWLVEFPSPNDVISMSLNMRPNFAMLDPDRRLLRRRKCEYELYRSVEAATWLPRVQAGFSSIDEFVELAQTVLQRRRSRSGRSLEKHIFQIFAEEQLEDGIHFEAQVETEKGRTPDFIFPNEAAYLDRTFEDSKLRMLAVKTTLRERWAQVVEEASRIQIKHLLTLQEGVSEDQYARMREAGLRLVVPKRLHRRFPEKVRAELLTLQAFIQEISDL